MTDRIASNFTSAEINSILLTLDHYIVTFGLLALFSSLAIIGIGMKHEINRGREMPRCFLFAPAIILGSVVAGCLVAELVIYFGIPGTIIGAVLPATCNATSMAIEGENGLPCMLGRMSMWLAHVLREEGSWHLDEIEPEWIVIWASVREFPAKVALGSVAWWAFFSFVAL